MATTKTNQPTHRPEGKEGTDRASQKHVGGQGMGQGRGMNPGEVHDRPEPGDDNTQKGGDRSNRAAHSGATGERHPGGGANKPAPRDQDEKGMGRPRNG